MVTQDRTPILEFHAVTFRYAQQEQPALDNVSLAIPRGARVAVLGQNGSGKSTLFLHANGILQPKSGRVHVDGTAISYRRANLQTLRRRVGVVFQQADDQIFSASVAQDISFGPLNLGLSEEDARQCVSEVAAQCSLTDLLDRPTHSLSGGEKSRVALAGVLAMHPDLLLIDEPTASLDPQMRQQIFSILSALHAECKTIVVATHEIDIARHWADFVVVMSAGRILAMDVPDTILSDTELMGRTGLDIKWWLA